MASPDDDPPTEAEVSGMANLQIENAETDGAPSATTSTPAATGDNPTTQLPIPGATPDLAPQPQDFSVVISNNAPGFKYKYPEAKPTPPGVDDAEWNKIFTAADSRFYNKAHKNANASKVKRGTGETRALALQMLQEKREKAAASAKDTGASTGPATKTKAPAARKSQPAKKEASTSSREMSPTTMDMAERIKTEGRARKAPSVAASSDRGTPAPSTAPKMGSAPPAPPKPQKPGPKKGPGPMKKKQDKKALSKGLLAPDTPSSSRQTSQTPGPKNGASSGDESNDGGEYCICRGPDDHRMMVYCEGGCEDWYHCSCIGIDEADAKELLDRFICPKCKIPGELFTTYKPMCRYFNVGTFLNQPACRKAARVTMDPPNMYCSDEHQNAFWVFVAARARQSNEPSKGGALNRAEIYTLLKQCKNVAEFQALGGKPRLPRKEGDDPDRPLGLDYLTPEEEKEIEEIKQKKLVIQHKIEGYQKQLKLLKMVIERAKIAAQHLKPEVKSICGYDNRLSFNEFQFEKWSKTVEGRTALETGVLGPRTAETKDINAAIPYPGQVIPEPPDVPDILNNICLRPENPKCQHNKLCSWKEVHNTDFAYNMKLLRDKLDKLTIQEMEIIDDAETREATKDYYSDNVTIQLF